MRQISQAGLFPANCRLLDANEALFNGAGDGTKHLLILAFESSDHDKTYSLDRALDIAKENEGLLKSLQNHQMRTVQVPQEVGEIVLLKLHIYEKALQGEVLFKTLLKLL